jgi:hypothetical protein
MSNERNARINKFWQLQRNADETDRLYDELLRAGKGRSKRQYALEGPLADVTYSEEERSRQQQLRDELLGEGAGDKDTENSTTKPRKAKGQRRKGRKAANEAAEGNGDGANVGAPEQ